MNRRKTPKDPDFDKLLKDIVQIIKKTDKEIEKIRKQFPYIQNPLRQNKSTRTGNKKEKKK